MRLKMILIRDGTLHHDGYIFFFSEYSSDGIN